MTSSSGCSGKTRPGDENRPSTSAKKSTGSDPGEDFRERLATQLRDAYVFERNGYLESLGIKAKQYRPAMHYMGGKNYCDQDGDYPEGRIFESVWGNVAKTLFQEKIDPVEYVRRIFAALYGASGFIPTPAQLLSQRCRRIYEEASEREYEDMALAFRFQVNTAKQRISFIQLNSTATMEDATEEVLYDETIPLSSLFRYCVAVSMKHKRFKRLAELYRVGAAVQYVRSAEAYDEIWGEFIPDELKQKAERIYAKVQEVLAS